MNLTNILLIACLALLSVNLVLVIREHWVRYKKRKENEWP